jgi:hypothetical protein
LARQRSQAAARRIAGRRARWKLSGPPHRERASRRLDVRGARLHFLHPVDLSIHPFQRPGENLLALQRMFGDARETSSARFALSAGFASFLSRQSPLTIAHIAKALAQRPQVFERNLVDCRVVSSENDFVLVVTENAALEFAWNGHDAPSLQLFYSGPESN